MFVYTIVLMIISGSVLYFTQRPASKKIIMQATSLGLSYIEIVLRIVLSLVIGGVIGLERGSKSQPAGIHTHTVLFVWLHV